MPYFVPTQEHGGVRCSAGAAVLTRSHGELKELYGALLHAVAPFYPGETEAAAEAAGEAARGDGEGAAAGWEATLTRTYRASLDEAVRHGLRSVAMPLLGAGARGARGELEIAEALRVAAGAVAGWCDASEGSSGDGGDGGGGGCGDGDGGGGDGAASRMLTVRFGVQDSSTAHALCDAVAVAVAREELGLFAPAPSPLKERWALGN
jgi:O-acetyl-ADP-ribose deacetylase (regulator of RNase III)